MSLFQSVADYIREHHERLFADLERAFFIMTGAVAGACAGVFSEQFRRRFGRLSFIPVEMDWQYSNQGRTAENLIPDSDETITFQFDLIFRALNNYSVAKSVTLRSLEILDRSPSFWKRHPRPFMVCRPRSLSLHLDREGPAIDNVQLEAQAYTLLRVGGDAFGEDAGYDLLFNTFVAVRATFEVFPNKRETYSYTFPVLERPVPLTDEVIERRLAAFKVTGPTMSVGQANVLMKVDDFRYNLPRFREAATKRKEDGNYPQH